MKHIIIINILSFCLLFLIFSGCRTADQVSECKWDCEEQYIGCEDKCFEICLEYCDQDVIYGEELPADNYGTCIVPCEDQCVKGSDCADQKKDCEDDCADYTCGE